MSLEVLDRMLAMLAKLPRNKCGSTSGQVTGFVGNISRAKITSTQALFGRCPRRFEARVSLEVNASM